VADLTASERVRALVGPSLVSAGLELVDVELHGPVLKVTVDRDGGVDLDAISDATRLVSDRLDSDPDVFPGRYTLEVSSPGVERPLRTPEQFRRFVGELIAVKTLPGTEGDRRVEGRLDSVEEGGVVVAGRFIAHADIERARTVFVWPEPGPKKDLSAPRSKSGSKAGAGRERAS